MADPSLFRLRVEYVKQGRLVMLSHLEIARALERAVRRAGLPFAVSNGFSPHMRISFGSALPVGVGGACEIFDLLLTSYVAPDKVLSALQDESVADLMPRACRYIESRDLAASVAYPVGSYRARLSCAPDADLFVPAQVEVVRKKKTKVLNVADYLVGDFNVEGSVVDFELEAKPTGSLRPDVLLAAVVNAYNTAHAASEAPLKVVSIIRTAQRHSR